MTADTEKAAEAKAAAAQAERDSMAEALAKATAHLDVPFEGDEISPVGKTVNIVTTEPGFMKSLGGLAPIGTRGAVPLEAFSRNWMKPADADSAKAVSAHLKKVDAAAAAAKAEAKKG